MASTVGVLALQGAFASHSEALGRCGVKALEVRTAAQLAACDALILPGGESTTISKLLATFEMEGLLRERLADGLPVFGTCAGMILLSASILDGRSDQFAMAAIDLDVRRNGYGRQVNSFEIDLDLSALGGDLVDGAFTAVFIRAPKVERAGENVEVLAEHEGVPVLCRSGSVLVSCFHPELARDDRLHRHFLHFNDLN